MSPHEDWPRGRLAPVRDHVERRKAHRKTAVGAASRGTACERPEFTWRPPDSFQVPPQEEEAWAVESGERVARKEAVRAVDGNVDRWAVEDALRPAVRRHESMRTAFVRRASLTLPLRLVNELLEPSIETRDLADADPLQALRAAPTVADRAPVIRTAAATRV